MKLRLRTAPPVDRIEMPGMYLHISWCRNSTDTALHARANDVRVMSSGRGDLKAIFGRYRTTGDAQIWCSIKHSQPDKYCRIDIKQVFVEMASVNNPFTSEERYR